MTGAWARPTPGFHIRACSGPSRRPRRTSARSRCSCSWSRRRCAQHEGQPEGLDMSPTSIFAPVSTPADSIFELSMFVLAVTAGIFVVVFGLLVYAVVRFRRRRDDDGSEPPQVYGSYEVELAWTIVPVLIVVALFLATARVIASVQHPPKPKDALDVVVIGHQYWWEYRYPKFGVVSANELHVPVSDPAHPTPTFLTLLSADTDHSFWVPRLAGKADLNPNHPNS